MSRLVVEVKREKNKEQGRGGRRVPREKQGGMCAGMKGRVEGRVRMQEEGGEVHHRICSRRKWGTVMLT